MLLYMETLMYRGGPSGALWTDVGFAAGLYNRPKVSEDPPLVYLQSKEGLPTFRAVQGHAHSTPAPMRCPCVQMGSDEAHDAAERPTGLNEAFSTKYST